jgi:WD40 repeat protein
MLKDAVN